MLNWFYMTRTPFETSLEINAVSQMLELTKPPYDSAAASAPSSKLENILGFDVALPFLKVIFLQFKRPYILNYRYKPFSFHTDHPGQLETLHGLAQLLPRTVFYALPLVEDNSGLLETLENTLFVRCECLEPGTSRIRVYRNYSLTKSSPTWTVDRLRMKEKNGDWRDLSDDCWYTWDQFQQGLSASESGIETWIEDEFMDFSIAISLAVFLSQRQGANAKDHPTRGALHVT